MRRNLYFVISFILLFYAIISPCLNDNSLNKSVSGIRTISSPDSNMKTESNCRRSSINPRIMTRLNLSCRQFYSIVIEKEPILHEEFESVVVVEKFRPQEPRKMTDENTNKCLLLANDCAIMQEGDFVTVQTCV